MTATQKVSVSLLIAVVLFAGFAALAFTGLFDLVEARFYNPTITKGLERELAADARVTAAYFSELRSRFAAAVADGAVRRSFLPNQSAQDVFERSRIFGLLMEETSGLQSARFIDAAGKRIHFSTSRSDELRKDRLSVAYRNYGDAQDDLPFEKVSAAEGSAPRIVVDAKGDRFLFAFPFLDSFDVYKGTAVFAVSVRGLAERLTGEGRLRVGEDLALVADPEGAVSGLPRVGRELLLSSVASVWSDGTFGPTPLASSGSGSAYALISGKTADGFITGRIVGESVFTFPQAMKGILLVSFFLTVFLIVFLLFNLRQDSLTVIRDRIKRFQIALMEEYYDRKGDLDWTRWKRELELRREDVRAELKRDISGTAPKRLSADIDELIDKSWDELLSAIGGRAGAPVTAQIDEGRLQDILGRVMAMAPVAPAPSIGKTKDGKAPIPAKPSSGVSAAGPQPREGEAGDIEEIEEVEAVEEVPDAEEVAEVEAAGESVEELEEIEEAEAVEALEEVEVAEEIAMAEAIGEPVEELEEIEEAEAAEEIPEAVEEVEPAEEVAEVEAAGESVEELEEIEEAEAAEEIPEAVEEVEPAEEVAEVEAAGEPVEELEEIEEAEAVKALEQVEPVEAEEQVDRADTLEVVDEAAAPEEIAGIEEAIDILEEVEVEVAETGEIKESAALEVPEEVAEAIDILEEGGFDEASAAEAYEEIPENQGRGTVVSLDEGAEAQEPGETQEEELEELEAAATEGEEAEELESLEILEEPFAVFEAEEVEDIGELEELAEVDQGEEVLEAESEVAEELEALEGVIDSAESEEKETEVVSLEDFEAEQEKAFDLDKIASAIEFSPAPVQETATALPELEIVSPFEGLFGDLGEPEEFVEADTVMEANETEGQPEDIVALEPLEILLTPYRLFTAPPSEYIETLESIQTEAEESAADLLAEEDDAIELRDGIPYVSTAAAASPDPERFDPDLRELIDSVIEGRSS